MNRQTVLTSVLVVAVLIIGFIAGRMTTPTPQGFIQAATELGTAAPQQTADTSGTVSSSQSGGTTINTSGLSDSQRQMLNAMGIDADNITITPEMVACAEAKLGAARIEEIKNGATPSFSEGATLMACYR